MPLKLLTRHLLVSGAALGLILSASTASADGTRSRSGGGALGRTTSAVHQATTSHSSGSGSSGGSSSSSSDQTSSDYHYHDYGYGYGPMYCPTCTYAPGGPPSTARPGAMGRSEISLDLGAQSVHDSDGAIMGDLRIAHGNLGLGLSGTHYFERGLAMDGSDTIYMNVWAVTLGYRGFDNGATQFWLTGGLAGSSSNNFDALRGATLGVELHNRLTRSLRVGGTARYFLLSEGMRASELKAAIAASYVSLGYRVFKFDVGEPLYGPELGISLRF